MATSISAVHFPSLGTPSISKLSQKMTSHSPSDTNFSFRNLCLARFFPKRRGFSSRTCCLSVTNLSAVSVGRKNYEFSDGEAEVELRLPLEGRDIQNSRDIFVDVKESSLTIKLQSSGSLVPLMETTYLYEKIKPSETIWYIDEDELVVNLKKLDMDLKWPDITETWESLSIGVMQLLKGASVYIVGESTEANWRVAQELALGLGYTPLNTSELLETFAQKTINSWVDSEGVDAVAEAEAAILESLSSHIRAVVATLGGSFGAAIQADRWRHLHAGFTIWVSQTEAADEASAREEAQRNVLDGVLGYAKADATVKLSSWDPDHRRTVAQSCLSALKQSILSDKELPGKKSLYIRLGCRGDWPNIKSPGWDPSSALDVSSDP